MNDPITPGIPAKNDNNRRMVTSYSMWSSFRNCRKQAYWRYIENLAPIASNWNLSFGRLIHECLATWHATRDLQKVAEVIDEACAHRAQDPEIHRAWHLARAMMGGYARRYSGERFEVVALEEPFAGTITNPATGADSRSFVLGGRVDGIVKLDGEYFLLEHKTTSSIDDGYLDRLWTDFQITLYAHYLEKTHGLTIRGVIYNILVKARIQQGQGETEEAFAERKAKLIAKSKTGKSNAKRRQPESDIDFHNRLADKYEDDSMFHREIVYFSRERFEELEGELWELTKAFLDARRRDVWYQNTAHCFHYRSPCAYFELCRSQGNPTVRENLYQLRRPHDGLPERAA